MSFSKTIQPSLTHLLVFNLLQVTARTNAIKDIVDCCLLFIESCDWTMGM